ncbi:hypothetical protein CFIO01_02128 [Colletotrichum fioriniae PJ7]|uniref:Uncharacterized protein n=1 Tax=Colletotrichum fioriniae PJ7 TaxID=1445577 RepID=A0A010R887_9PEZI|nr:hypothetical protein CFIO01_02128 [Colletotrichum fioriniae PJ7]
MDAPADTPALGSLPAASLHSTDVSSLISEKDSTTETESRDTNPSSSPPEPDHNNNVSQETLSQQDHGDLQAEEASQIHPAADDVPESDLQDDGSEATDSSSITRDFKVFRSDGEFKLRTIARELNSSSWNFADPDDHSNKSAINFANHLKMMNWISKVIKDNNRPLPPPSSTSSPEDNQKRERHILGIKEYGWVDWWGPRGEFVMDIMVEEEPLKQEDYAYRIHGRSHLKPTVLQPRTSGLAIPPNRLSINSVPLRRITSTLTNGSLPSGVLLTMFRPFKLLHWLEPNIRQRLLEIQNLCISSSDHDKGIQDSDGPTEDDAEKEDGSEKDVQLPRSGRPNRDDIIFTSAYDWKSLTRAELQEAADDLGVLVSFIDKFINPLREALQGTDDVRVHYQELWHVFRPGTIVYIKDPGVPQKLWRVVQGTGGQVPPYRSPSPRNASFQLGGALKDLKPLPFVIECYHLDFDGTQFIRVFKNFKFQIFRDLTSVRSLPIVPLNIAERDGFIDKEDYMIRGKHFIAYTKWSYAYYRGQSLVTEPEGTMLRRPETGAVTSAVVVSEAIESPVVVDFYRCIQEVPNWKPGRSSRGSWRMDGDSGEHNEPADPGLIPHPFPPGTDDDRLWDIRMAEEVLNYSDQSQPVEVYGREPPERAETLLLPNRVFAFVLRTRRWACIPLGFSSSKTQQHSLTRMTKDYNAWDYLQIDDGHRTIIKSLMATHFRKNKSERRQFDIIQDKGMTPTEVEANLQAAFQMAQAWECVLLLDEADVFLAERSQDNIERNALVSVFLRVMEYYEGILFLTTNKVGSFDEAFKSRMSMALYYPPLTHDQTKKIWEVQMDRTEKLSVAAAPGDPSQHVKFNRDEITSLSATLWSLQNSRDDHKPVWNGRQIRNAFQTAVALAEFHQQENHISGPIIVKGEHFEKVAKASHEFNAYLYSVRHERLEKELALKKEHRFDDFNRSQFGFGGQGLAMGRQGVFSEGFGMPAGFQNPQQFTLSSRFREYEQHRHE